MTDEVVTRLYRCLVEELRRRGHPDGRPVKVSELYQELVPYRAVRSALGVELNADYEHALLRLLAGERSLLRLEPAQAREELRREVDAPYPFVGLFRKFSASSVWVNMPEARREDGTATDAAPTPSSPARMPDNAPPAPPATMSPAEPDRLVADAPPPRIAAEVETVPLRARRSSALAPARAPVQIHRVPEPVTDPGDRITEPADCAFCGETLPAGRRARYCPHCGSDQRLQPCPKCEAVLERGWRYCITCGHEVAG